MKSKNDIMQAINRLTLEIEMHFPELYPFLDETRETIPYQQHPSMDFYVLQRYLRGLQELLGEYKKTHRPTL